MQHVCHYCEKETDRAHGITLYAADGTEDRWEVLCPSCYEDWVHSQQD